MNNNHNGGMKNVQRDRIITKRQVKIATIRNDHNCSDDYRCKCKKYINYLTID